MIGSVMLAKIKPKDENNDDAIAEFFEICNKYIDALAITIEAAVNMPIAGKTNSQTENENNNNPNSVAALSIAIIIPTRITHA